MKLIDIQSILENWCPIKNAEDFDNVGLLVGDNNSNINKALITIDTTEAIIDEAVNLNCNLIITFHPLLYKGHGHLNSEEYVTNIILKAINNNINIYAIHTNLDNNPEGVSFQISKKLGLSNLEILMKKEEDQSIGMGMVGDLEIGMEETDFLNFLKEKMEISNLRHSNFRRKIIKKVAADAYVTADLKYHDFFKPNNKTLLVDIGHYESEKYTKELILEYLNKKIPKFACIIAKTRTNPVNYF